MPNQVEKIKKAIETRPVAEEMMQNEGEMIKVDDLKQGLAEVNNKNNAIASNGIIDENKIEELRSELIKDLLKKLSEIGVDPGDTESINNFIKNLEMQDPDLKILFESAFDGLLGGETGNQEQAQPTEDQSMGMMQAPTQGMQAPQQTPPMNLGA